MTCLASSDCVRLIVVASLPLQLEVIQDCSRLCHLLLAMVEACKGALHELHHSGVSETLILFPSLCSGPQHAFSASLEIQDMGLDMLQSCGWHGFDLDGSVFQG